MRIFPILLFGILVLTAALMISTLSEKLPPIVAVHFNAAGIANGFATRAGCPTFMLGFTLGVPLFIVAVTSLLPRLLPASMINVPNRAYWLAPERASESIAFMSQQGIWFGCIFVVFSSVVDWLLFKANATAPPALDSAKFMGWLMLFFCAIAWLMVRMFRRFRAP